MFTKFKSNSSGMALVMVFVVLTGLFVIAVPFLHSMLQGRATAISHSSSVMAENDVNSLRNLAYQHLVNAQTVNQQYQAESGDVNYVYSALMMRQVPLNTPEYTTPGEIMVQPNLSRLLDSTGSIHENPTPMIDVLSAHDRLWTVKVEDEQGKIDLNTASYFVLGNLIGATSLTSDLTENSSSSIQVMDASWLPPYSGHVIIGQELIGYDKISTDQKTIYDLSRSASADVSEFSGTGGIYPMEYSVAYPGSAYKIAAAKFDRARNEGQLYNFPDVKAIREISTYVKFGNSYSDALDANRYDNIADSLTVYSSGDYPGTFYSPHVLTSNLPQGQVDQTNGTFQYNDLQFLTVSNNQAINAGSVLKITADTGEVAFCMARAVNGNRVIINRALPYNLSNNPPYTFRANRAIVEVMARKPVNINTASRQVLVAILTGLQINKADIISSSEAGVVADRILERVYDDYEPFTSSAEFSNFIRSNYNEWNSTYGIDLTSADITAIILNANRNYDPRLLNPTMPFNFRAFDTYKLLYSVIINNSADRIDATTGQPVPGIPIAKYSEEEIRRIGTENLVLGGKRLLGMFRQQEYADYLYARDSLFAGTGLKLDSHSTGYTTSDGESKSYITASLPYAPDYQGKNVLDFSGLGRHYNQGEPLQLDAHSLGIASGQGVMHLRTGSIKFWFKIDEYNNTQPTIIMDSAASQYQNRLTLFYEPTRRALVLRILATDLEAAAYDYVFPLRGVGNAGGGIRSDTWYHAMITWKGTDIQEILQGTRIKVQFNLLLDGLGASPINRIPGYFTHTYYPDGWDGDTIRERYSYLARALDAPNGTEYDENVHQIVLEDGSGFPSSGVVQINDEVIFYSRKNAANGNILEGLDVIEQVDPNTGATITLPNGLIRGARGSVAASHEIGSAVSLWGYSLTLRHNTLAPYLPAVKGMLGSRFGRQTGPVRIFNEDTENTDYDDYQNVGPLAGLPEDEMRIIAQPGTFDDFPERGYALVWGDVITDYQTDEQTGQKTAVMANPGNLGEIVFYDGILTDTDQNGTEFQYLDVVERNAITWNGQPSGAAAMPDGSDSGTIGYHFANNANVMLISIELDDTTNYHSTGGYVMLSERNEIFRYTGPEPTKKNGEFLIYNLDTNQWRGQFGSGRRNYTETENPKALPLFMINSRERITVWSAGPDDKVTVVQSLAQTPQNLQADGDYLRVLWANNSAGANLQWIVLSDFVNNGYAPGNGTRLIKFPSCELPVNIPSTFTFGQPSSLGSSEAGFGGTFDEVRWYSTGAGDFFLVNGISETDTTVQVNITDGMNNDVGIIKVDNELIAYARISNGRLLNCTRGFLGTVAKPHGRFAKFINIAHVTCAKMNSNHMLTNSVHLNITANDRNALGNEGYFLGGTLPFNFEVFRYQRAGNRYSFSDYTPGNQGLYRGMFGTPGWDFRTNDVVVLLPYRYKDKFKTSDTSGSVNSTTNNNNNNTNTELERRFVNSPEQNCIGGAHAEPGAKWLRVHWAIEDDVKLRRREGNYMRIHMFVKPSNVVSWTDPRVKHLIFNHNRYVPGTGSSEDATIVTAVSSLQQVDDLDLQADGIEWRVGFEFVNNAFLHDSWKWSPTFLGCYFEYEQDGKIYYSSKVD